MKIQTLVAGALACAVITPVALAQQAGAPKAGAAAPNAGAAPKAGVATAADAPEVKHGPPLTGVCVYSKENLAADTKVGQYVDQRLLQIQAQVAAQVNQASNALNAATSNAQAQVDALPADQRNGPQVQNLRNDIQRQAQDFVNLRNEMAQRFDFTVEAALNRVYREGATFLQQVYEQRRCSMLFNTEGLIAFNPAMDLTPDIVKLVDARITEFQFELVSAEALRAPAQDGQATPATGASPAPARGGAATPAAPSRGPSGPPRAN